MKALAGLLGALFGLILVGVGAYWALGRKPVTATTAAPSMPAPPTGRPRAAEPVKPPVTHEEQLREELGRKRLPFYRYLRQNYGDMVERFSVLEDFDTLDLVVMRADEHALAALVQQAIAPSAKEYGFRRVRFYTRNPPASVEPFTVVAESSEDGSGRWNTFMK